MSSPVATTAMLLEAPANPPRCAAESIPNASPLTTVSPALLIAVAKDSAVAIPCGVALRLPMIARQGWVRSWGLPLAYSRGGGSVVCSRG
jgi:hypothetical protein